MSGFEVLQMEIVGGERNHCQQRQLSSRDLRQPYISGAADASPPAAGNASRALGAGASLKPWGRPLMGV